jgi:two-component system sensor histidine kinase RpfC
MRWVRRLAALKASALDRLRRSGDREHEMLGNRLAFGGLVSSYLLLFMPDDLVEEHRLRLLCAVYCAGALLLLAHPLVWPGMSRLRRLAAVFIDIGVLSYGFHLGSAVTSPFFAIYFWVILGNGFRFGLPWLRISATASVAGFGLVVLHTPYWQDNLPLGLGLLAGLLAIPLYAGRLIRTLSDAKLRAEEANKAKSAFLASVSHELRTPLNAVIGMAGLIASTPLTPGQREMAGTIDTSSKVLLSLIDGILDLSRIEAGRMPVASDRFDLAEVLAGVMDIVSVRGREKGLRMALHITSRTPLDLIGDARHLSEILLNLVSNAIKFTQSGVVVLAADVSSCAKSGCQLRIEVTDTGIGIAPEAQERIFDDFVQADGTIINRFGGTGLGLAITSRLVALLDGQISVHSVEGQGSTFTIMLPVALAEPAAVQPAGTTVLVGTADAAAMQPLLQRLRTLGCTVAGAGDPALQADAAGPRVLLTSMAADAAKGTGQGADGGILVAEPSAGLPPLEVQQRFATVVPSDASDGSLAAALRIAARHPAAMSPDQAMWTRPRPLRVLVADDNAVNTRVVDLILRRAGHSTTIVRDGEAALDAMTEGGFDMVLMDVNMPVMTGLDAVKLYRFGALGLPHLPVIGLTADVTNEIQRRCREAGMDRCLLKPIEPGVLLDALDALAASHGAQPRTVARSLPGPVTDIATHPRFRGSASAAVNMATVAQLRELGGDDFLDGLICDFLADAGRLQTVLAEAARSGDMAALGAEAHALYSAAGNMGAEPVRQICRALQDLSLADMAGPGQHLLHDLAGELARVTKALQGLRPGAGLPEPSRREAAAGVRTLLPPR